MITLHVIQLITACIIAFIFGIIATLFFSDCLSYLKDKKQRNKVRFFVTCSKNVVRNKLAYELWLFRPTFQKGYKFWYAKGKTIHLCDGHRFYLLNLNLNDYADMQEGEIREVFINFKD